VIDDPDALRRRVPAHTVEGEPREQPVQGFVLSCQAPKLDTQSFVFI
jgi:hypothetical protein